MTIEPNVRAPESDLLAAENTRLRQQVESLKFTLRNLTALPPLDPSRQEICRSVEQWVRDARGGNASIFEIAQAVLQAAVTAGWVAAPETHASTESEIADLIRTEERRGNTTLAYLLDCALIEAKRVSSGGQAS